MGRVQRKQNNRVIGAQYEQEAGRYLESIGYRILQYNYRCKVGEIDIIAQDGEYLVFCEVKYRAGTAKGMPVEAVNHKKQKILSKCALFYVTEHGYTQAPCRFDVIGILRGEGGNAPEISHYKNAFLYSI